MKADHIQGVRYGNGISVPLESRKKICTWCAETVHRHLCLMNSMCDGIISDQRLHNTTVGLLYLLRNGIIVHDTVVLPKLQVLDVVLPLESHLQTFFGIRAKCITETENVIKIILRHVTKHQLLAAGVAQVACKF